MFQAETNPINFVVLLYTFSIFHIAAGILSLFIGPLAMFSRKGKNKHRLFGNIYAGSMTLVFITAVVLSTVKLIPFLFMIAFISYYSVFAGYRILKLKRLHHSEKPRWFDWAAGLITALVGIAFLLWGGWPLLTGTAQSVNLIALFFGLLTLIICWIGLKPFFIKPEHKSYWLFYHLGNMVGSYAAASTAFFITVGGMAGFHSPILWILPTLILSLLLPKTIKHQKEKYGLT